LIADSHQRMLTRLREVHAESRDNPYFGRGALLAANQKYETAKSSGDFMGTLEAIESVGRELTFSGKPDDALKTFDQADKLLMVMRQSGAPPGLISTWDGRIVRKSGLRASQPFRSPDRNRFEHQRDRCKNQGHVSRRGSNAIRVSLDRKRQQLRCQSAS